MVIWFCKTYKYNKNPHILYKGPERSARHIFCKGKGPYAQEILIHSVCPAAVLQPRIRPERQPARPIRSLQRRQCHRQDPGCRDFVSGPIRHRLSGPRTGHRGHHLRHHGRRRRRDPATRPARQVLRQRRIHRLQALPPAVQPDFPDGGPGHDQDGRGHRDAGGRDGRPGRQPGRDQGRHHRVQRFGFPYLRELHAVRPAEEDAGRGSGGRRRGHGQRRAGGPHPGGRQDLLRQRQLDGAGQPAGEDHREGERHRPRAQGRAVHRHLQRQQPGKGAGPVLQGGLLHGMVRQRQHIGWLQPDAEEHGRRRRGRPGGFPRIPVERPRDGHALQ